MGCLPSRRIAWNRSIDCQKLCPPSLSRAPSTHRRAIGNLPLPSSSCTSSAGSSGSTADLARGGVCFIVLIGRETVRGGRSGAIEIKSFRKLPDIGRQAVLGTLDLGGNLLDVRAELARERHSSQLADERGTPPGRCVDQARTSISVFSLHRQSPRRAGLNHTPRRAHISAHSPRRDQPPLSSRGPARQAAIPLISQNLFFRGHEMFLSSSEHHGEISRETFVR